MGFFKKISDIFGNIFSGRGTISAKRVTGTWLIGLVSFCVVWIMIHEGGTPVVESLLETSLVIAASLLGLSSVTGIFKEGRVATNDAAKEMAKDDNTNPDENQEL